MVLDLYIVLFSKILYTLGETQGYVSHFFPIFSDDEELQTQSLWNELTKEIKKIWPEESNGDWESYVYSIKLCQSSHPSHNHTEACCVLGNFLSIAEIFKKE